jgi:hypothetical protein
VKEPPSESVILRAPKSRSSIPLLRVVIGGVAARRSVRVDQLDDLQLAVETLVVEERSYEGDLVLTVAAGEDGLAVTLAGLCNSEVKSLLQDRGAEKPRSAPPTIDVRMLLAALVDAYRVSEDDGERFAVVLEKRIS